MCTVCRQTIIYEFVGRQICKGHRPKVDSFKLRPTTTLDTTEFRRGNQNDGIDHSTIAF